MGIRFDCPNGHHLNVKAFLAGRRGFCPDCGVKLLIPSQSQGQPDALDQADNQDPANASSVIDVKIDRTRHTTDPRRQGSARRRRRQSAAIIATPDSSTLDGQLPVASQPAMGHSQKVSAAETSGDAQVALDEAWFVRPPAGGQYGPASGATIAKWIQEGRIVRETYMWRGGWSSWQLAGDVADQLPATLPSAVQSAAGSRSDDTNSTIGDKASTTHLEILRARRRGRRRQWLAALVLFVLVIVLSGLLIWVLILGAR